MARPKEFDVEQTLERAMNLFWERGYEATSMSDLVEHLGISRQSLYDTFGDKHAIFTTALERFRDQQGRVLREVMAGDLPVRAQLKRLFAHVIEQDLSGKCPRGCMLVNTAVELSVADEPVRQIIAENMRAVEGLLVKCFRRALEKGEIGAHHDPSALGRFFFTILAGLRVSSKARRDRRALEDAAQVALGVLG